MLSMVWHFLLRSWFRDFLSGNRGSFSRASRARRFASMRRLVSWSFSSNQSWFFSLCETENGLRWLGDGIPNCFPLLFHNQNNPCTHAPPTPTAISERLMALRVPLPQNNFITVLSAYAPTLDADEDVKNQLYDQLSATIYSVPSRDKLLLLDDFNARVGRTTTCGKISSAKKAWETATKTDSFCSASAPNMHSPSRTRCSACQIVSKQHGDIRAESTGTCWTTPSSANLTGKTSLPPPLLDRPPSIDHAPDNFHP